MTTPIIQLTLFNRSASDASHRSYCRGTRRDLPNACYNTMAGQCSIRGERRRKLGDLRLWSYRLRRLSDGSRCTSSHQGAYLQDCGDTAWGPSRIRIRSPSKPCSSQLWERCPCKSDIQQSIRVDRFQNQCFHEGSGGHCSGSWDSGK